jgi:hypothetical protein
MEIIYNEYDGIAVTPFTYWEGTRFEFRAGYRLPWLRLSLLSKFLQETAVKEHVNRTQWRVVPIV